MAYLNIGYFSVVFSKMLLAVASRRKKPISVEKTVNNMFALQQSLWCTDESITMFSSYFVLYMNLHLSLDDTSNIIPFDFIRSGRECK